MKPKLIDAKQLIHWLGTQISWCDAYPEDLGKRSERIAYVHVLETVYRALDE